MAYNSRSGSCASGYGGGCGYGGYGGKAGRYMSGGGAGSGYRTGVIPWQSGGCGGGVPAVEARQGLQQQQFTMASNIDQIPNHSLSSGPGGMGGGYGNRGNWGAASGLPSQRMVVVVSPKRNKAGGKKKRCQRRNAARKEVEKRKPTEGGDKPNNKKRNAKNAKMYIRTQEQMEADKRESYSGVPSAVLYCHVCSKYMWDSESFVKHIQGKPHELMVTYLDEAYKMKVDLMRHKIQALEMQREIDMQRVKIKNIKISGQFGDKNVSRSYCKMCDVRFYGPLANHRKSDRHRRLKQFLHPDCKLCNALFHTRLEMDEHKLTAGHLKKVAKYRTDEYPELKNDEIDLMDMIKFEVEDQLDDQDQMPIAKKYEMLCDRDAVKLKWEMEGRIGRETKNKQPLENVEVKEEKEKKEEATVADENKVDPLDLVADYNPNVAIGKELLVPSTGYVCRLCTCYLRDLNGVALHCQTAAHYINYTTMKKMKDAKLNAKKRGIDQVKEETQNDEGIEEGKAAEENGGTDERATKRIKLEENSLETEVKMETSETDTAEVAEIVKTETVTVVPEIEEMVTETKTEHVVLPKEEILDSVKPKEENEVQEPEMMEVKIEKEPTPEAEPVQEPEPVVQTPPTPAKGRGGRGGGRGRRVARRGRPLR